MPISAVDAITPAFQHARQQLLQPFRTSQWAKLGLVGLLAGEMSSGGGGCNPGAFQLPTPPHHTQRFMDLGLPSIDPVLMASLIGVLIVAGVVFMVLFLYVSSVMRFVLFDSVIARDCRIRASWSRAPGSGLALFCVANSIFFRVPGRVHHSGWDSGRFRPGGRLAQRPA